ncbi:MAG: DUF2992 family protein [Spirochaetales bacterium]|nr:DUF2992 family protein [Spirochaetales bacterium]
MDEVITTIYFDGQFWAALVEKISPDGSVHIARFTFGPEPTKADIRDFYFNHYHRLHFHKGEERFRIPKKRSHKEQERTFSKSLTLYQESRTQYLLERKKVGRRKQQRKKEELFLKNQLKKKKKKKGH